MFLHAMKVGIVDKQGKPLSKEDYIKQIHLTVTLDAPQEEKKLQQTEDIETTVKKIRTKRNRTPDENKGNANAIGELKSQVKVTAPKNKEIL